MEKKFVEIARGSVKQRGRCIEVSQIAEEIRMAQRNRQELFRSHFFFDESLKEHLSFYKTVSGYHGKPIIESIIIDVDKGQDTNEYVFIRAKQMYVKLIDYGILENNIRIFYSGNGFHFQVPNVWNFTSHEEVKATISQDFPEADTSIYDKTRIIRVANTINAKCNRYKIPLEQSEFVTSTIDEILVSSHQPRNEFTFDNFEQQESLEHKKIIQKPILSVEHPMTQDGLSPIITCMQKLYNSEPRQGTRHVYMLRMISAFKRAGIPQSGIEAMMMQWTKGQLEYSEIKRITGDVFKKNYQYSCSDEVFHQYCDSRCMFYKHKSYNQAIPEDAAKLEDKMRIFALEGEDNVIINLKDFLHIPTDFKIFKQEFVSLIGDTGLGKSAFFQNISILAKNRKILYLNFEVGETLMYRRFLQIAHIKTKNAIIEYYLQPNPSSLAGPIEHINMISQRITIPKLEELVALTQYDIIIADTLECFTTPGISEITPKTEFLAHEMKRIAKKYNIVTVAVHHVSKHGIQDSDGSKKKLTVHSGKGAKAVEDQSDKVILFEGDQNNPVRIISSGKARDERPFKTKMIFDAENTFRFYPQTEEGASLLQFQQQNKESLFNSSESLRSSW